MSKFHNPNDAPVTMTCCAGIFIIGRLEIGGNKLFRPRVYTLFEDTEPDPLQPGRMRKAQKQQMSPLPGIPEFIALRMANFTYPVTHDKTILDLYTRVTTPQMEESTA